jgi:hypothetical protein
MLTTTVTYGCSSPGTLPVLVKLTFYDTTIT